MPRRRAFGGGQRRAVLLAAASLVLLQAPVPADAAFTATDTAPLTASTYSIPAPGSLTASFACQASGKQATVTVTGYGKVPRATAYLLTLTAPDGTSSSSTTNLDGVVLTQSSSRAGNRVYTISVQAEVGSWTGAALAQAHTC